MKALIIKDLYILKQMRLYLILMLVFACLPWMNSFSVIYSVMLPMTVLVYDEQSKWNNIAKMMPYSDKDMILSKYVIGYIFTACTVLISLIAQTVLSVINPESVNPENYIAIFLTASCSLIIMSVYLPIIFKTGVEKGRSFFVFLMIVIFGIVGALFGLFEDEENILFNIPCNLYAITIIGIAAAIIINILSVMISVKIYKSKKNK